MSNLISFEKIDNVALITIRNEDRRNALSKGVREGLFYAWETFESDKSLRVAILTGAGDKAFCAGADLKEMSNTKMTIPPRDYMPILGDNVSVTKPVIAAVNGVALAGGWLLAQMCDLCVASTNASFGVTEVNVGRGVPWATPLIHMIPQRIMLEVLMTGRPISAQRAYEIGFVNRLVAPDQLIAAAMEFAKEIAKGAPLTVDGAKEITRLATEMGRSAAMRAADHAFARIYESEDAQEGPLAFREKRAPQWQGK